MPIFDRRCDTCGFTFVDCVEPSDLGPGRCGVCGVGVTNRVWLPQTSPSIIVDTFPGGQFVQENFGPDPEVFTSKREMARRAKELGLEPMVRHVGTQGSDKNPHTTRWV